METTTLAWIWFLLPSILNSVKVTYSVEINYDYNVEKTTVHFQPGIPTERLTTLTSPYPLKRQEISEPAIPAFRSYRKAKPKKTIAGNPYDQNTFNEPNNIPQDYNSQETARTSDDSKKVIPLTGQDSNSSPEQNLPNSNNLNDFNFSSTPSYTNLNVPSASTTVKPQLTTEQYNRRTPSASESIYSTEPNDTLQENNTSYEYFDAVSNSNEDAATVTDINKWAPANTTEIDGWAAQYNNVATSTHVPYTLKEIENMPWLTPEVKNALIAESTALGLIGFETPIEDKNNETELIEKVMVLPLSNVHDFYFLKQQVHESIKHARLKRETEEFLIKSNRRYNDLPVIEVHNSSWRKYSRALVEYFLLSFCLNYPLYSESEEWTARYDPDIYARYYNMTLLELQKKKKYTALQFAQPVKRVEDIYRSILDTPIGIVQSKCYYNMEKWLCDAEYLVGLKDESEKCENIWYYAKFHLDVLMSVRNGKANKDPADIAIDELNLRVSPIERNEVNYLFDFIVQTLDDIRSKLESSLHNKVRLHNSLRRLQLKGKLTCFDIHDTAL